MNSGTITPVGGKHAIEVMAIGVEWATPMDSNGLQGLQAAYEETATVKEFLPSLTPVQAFALNIGAPGNFVAENRSGGFDLRRFDPSGAVLWAVSVRPELIACNCIAYDRWATVKPKAMALLDPFLSVALAAGNQIKAVGLQYQDAFRVSDEVGSPALKTLFRQNSNWIPAHLLNESSLWHSHQGWFASTSDGHRTLNNVNLDVLEQDAKLLVRIHGQHRVFAVTQDGKSPYPIAMQDIEGILDVLHQQNKAVLRGILAEDVLARIGFESEQK
ncbi:TIGR04255 family protein [Pandoraea cepalis]|uniref:TIGR04255 family protein n=1 Tax=Pandoraea cepalis TaxID=2508294 RepID=UPI00263B7059|nr:TIGR04255 family protein [Pandoraea cepalis]